MGAKRVQFGKDPSKRADFFVEIAGEEPVRVLQVTDTQIINSKGCRYEGRLSAEEMKKWAPENVGVRMTRYLDEAVGKAKPDLIVHTGDFVYGEFDDSGEMLALHIALMEKYGVPWTLALGNHERESKIGERGIADALQAAPHCLFRAGDTEGCGNFTVLVRRGGKDIAVLYVLDSGYWTEEKPHGIFPRQREWLERKARNFGGLPAFAFFHIPPAAIVTEAEKYGLSSDFRPFELSGKGTFGGWGEPVRPSMCVDRDGGLMELFRKIGVVGVFTGHFHKVNTSLLCGPVRVTVGYKTGEYDTHAKERLGGTLLTFPDEGEEGFAVRPVPVCFRED